MIAVMSLVLVSCTVEQAETNEADFYAPVHHTLIKPDTEGAIKLWATWYNMPKYKSDKTGIEVRDINGKPLGPKLSKKKWCNLAMEGTGFIDGHTFNYAGTSTKHVVKCDHTPSGRVKFYVTKYKYGVGSRNNPLRPFVSVACDQKIYPFGTRFFIPSARGVLLPDGTVHGGYFVCEDVGGLIKGNHIDVFIGEYSKNPFEFISSNELKTFEAFTVGDR